MLATARREVRGTQERKRKGGEYVDEDEGREQHLSEVLLVNTYRDKHRLGCLLFLCFLLLFENGLPTCWLPFLRLQKLALRNEETRLLVYIPPFFELKIPGMKTVYS